MMQKNKKAATMVVTILITILILFIVAFTIIWMQNRGFNLFGRETGRFIDIAQYEFCKQKADLPQTGDYIDVDGDKFPDDCDNCVCTNEDSDGVSICHNTLKDEDKDKIARGCEPDDGRSDDPEKGDLGKYSEACANLIAKEIDDGKPGRCVNPKNDDRSGGVMKKRDLSEPVHPSDRPG